MISREPTAIEGGKASIIKNSAIPMSRCSPGYYLNYSILAENIIDSLTGFSLSPANDQHESALLISCVLVLPHNCTLLM